MVGSWSRFTTQTATPAEKSGSGGPNVGPFSELAPVDPAAWHVEFVLASQPERQYLSVESVTLRKLCDCPEKPVSRSLPVFPTVMVS